MSDWDPRDTCSGCFGHGPCVDPARHGRKIGPIERELRTVHARGPVPYKMTWACHGVWAGACRQWLKDSGLSPDDWAPDADVASYAIEAAEALGL